MSQHIIYNIHSMMRLQLINEWNEIMLDNVDGTADTEHGKSLEG